ncbi:NAD(P)/FAD-dependent oxidoreductase [Cohnella thailandensis]|uniref:Ferredoxin--NADP reductase n=1 Tax=Cohnella thailandensis TaxID=557557 RepID=A0A841SVF6_9BACL|nr:NAD(P)/FAD-dependent oxidoreductase [Cohnella thailandensis]MBB6634586.1 NAD(P)/FAD-dependent oxidoreductase [Cohnella thailandensis]MBP1972858.1 thioredoxin reductase (NADPH) [Cohnella thailandensis]
MNQPRENEIVDMIIIGGGPTGMFAGFYAGMRQASAKIIDSMPQLGGQLAALYPEKKIFDVAGFPNVTAQGLVDRLERQMSVFPIQVRLEEKVLQVFKEEERLFRIVTDKGVHWGRSVIIAGGVGAFEPRKMDLPEAADYAGRGIHYFIRDLKAFAGQEVVVCGGGDSAVDWSLMLEGVAKRVTLIHRRDKFRAHEHSVDRLMKSSVNVLTSTDILQIRGDDRVRELTIASSLKGEEWQIPCDSLIVNYGFVSSLGPVAEWGLDIQQGSIRVDTRMETNIPGIFAAGDITTYPGKLKLIAVGFGEAPTAINNAKVYIDPQSKLYPGHSSHMKFN